MGKPTYNMNRRVPPATADPLKLHRNKSGALEEGRYMRIGLPGAWRNAPAPSGAFRGWVPRLVHGPSGMTLERLGDVYSATAASEQLRIVKYAKSPTGAILAATRGLRRAMLRFDKRAAAIRTEYTQLVALTRATKQAKR